MIKCLSCGSQILEDQQFCRECGFSLFPESNALLPTRTRALLAIAVFFGGTFAAFFGRVLNLEWLIFSGVFVMLVALFGLAFTFLWQGRTRRQTPAYAQKPAPVERADTTNKLLPIGDDDYISNIPSVVESTTRRLKTPNRSN